MSLVVCTFFKNHSILDMVKIHVAVIAIISTFFITTQAGNVRTEAYDPYAQEPMDRMVNTKSFAFQIESSLKILNERLLQIENFPCTSFLTLNGFSKYLNVHMKFLTQSIF